MAVSTLLFMFMFSFNGMTGSECEVIVDGCFNTSVHVSFQNPVNTPVKVKQYIIRVHIICKYIIQISTGYLDF